MVIIQSVLSTLLTQYWHGWSPENNLAHSFTVKASNLTQNYKLFYPPIHAISKSEIVIVIHPIYFLSTVHTLLHPQHVSVVTRTSSGREQVLKENLLYTAMYKPRHCRDLNCRILHLLATNITLSHKFITTTL